MGLDQATGPCLGNPVESQTLSMGMGLVATLLSGPQVLNPTWCSLNYTDDACTVHQSSQQPKYLRLLKGAGVARKPVNVYACHNSTNPPFNLTFDLFFFLFLFFRDMIVFDFLLKAFFFLHRWGPT